MRSKGELVVITNSNVGMDSARTYTSARKEVIKFSSVMTDQTNKVEETARKSEEDALSKIKSSCLSYLLKWLFRMDDDEIKRYLGTDNIETVPRSNTITVTQEVSYFESEETSFSTQGTVVCADGREINFNLEVGMSRSFTANYQYESQMVQCMDPLVINLDTDCAGVSDQKFYFDLDQDGEEEELSMLSAGSGFLALDLNEDGKINDGGELFGTKSGNGFADLAKYDLDHNGWIDEKDAIFEKLKIVTFTEDGEMQIYRLKDRGVGAMYLGNVSTEFSLNQQMTNKTNAVIRATGLYLYENGNVGSMQQLDLAT